MFEENAGQTSFYGGTTDYKYRSITIAFTQKQSFSMIVFER